MSHNTTVHKTVKNMIDEIGQLRVLVAIDNMPEKLQRVRQLLRELDAEYEGLAKQSRRAQAGGEEA